MNNSEKAKRAERKMLMVLWFQIILGAAVIAYCYTMSRETYLRPENVSEVTKDSYRGLYELYKIVAFSALPGLAIGQIILALMVIDLSRKRSDSA